MLCIAGGIKWFMNIIRKKGYDQKAWSFYIAYAKDNDYGPQRCEGVCEYCETCRHKKNMVLTVKEPDVIIRTCQDHYESLSQVQDNLWENLNDAVRLSNPGIRIIRAQTAVGKTEQYCRLISQDTKNRYIIAVPTNRLKAEVSQRLKIKGISVEDVLSLKDVDLPDELNEKIKFYFRCGLGRDITKVLKGYIKEHKMSTDPFILRTVENCKRYLKSENRIKKSRVAVMIHAKLLTLSETVLKDFIVIIDEDILSTIFKNINTVKVSSIEKCINYYRCSESMESSFQQILDTPIGTLGRLIGDKSPAYFTESDLKGLNICENVNEILYCSCFYREKEYVHYFCSQSLPAARYIVMSATAEAWLYKKYFTRMLIEEYPYQKAKYVGSLKQYTYYSMSRQCIQDNKQELLKFIAKYKDTHKMITFLKFEKEFNGCGLHFGNAEGHDSLNGKDILVIGTPHLSEFVYKLIGYHLGMEVQNDTLSVRRIEHNGYQFNMMTYKNEDLRNLQLYFINKELEQCIGRARLLRNPCEALLFSNFPCDQAELFQEDYLNDITPETEAVGESVMAGTL